MGRRIGIWAFAGFAVAVCWAFLFAVIFGHKLNFSLRTAIEIAVRITVPVAWFGRKIR